MADVITLADETISPDKPFEIFDPHFIWKRKTITNFKVRKLQEQTLLKRRRLIYDLADDQRDT